MKKKIIISILTIGLFNLANCEKIENVHAEEEVNKTAKEIVQVDLEKSKTILDNKDYYTMNEDERKTIDELVKRWNDEIDYSFKSEYVYKKALYERDKYYDENY